MLQANTRWQIQNEDKVKAEKLAKALGVSPLLGQLLLNRELDTVDKAQAFLNIRKQDFHDPFLLDGMTLAVDRIHLAIENKEKILVFGDYDADGVSSTSLLMRVLNQLGANASYYIPNRFTEGYGPNVPALEQAKSQGISLVITVDTGIAAHDPAEAARQMNLDYIVTDHHEPAPTLPDAYAIINPKKPNCPYPFKHLAGVGVAFKLASALLGNPPVDLLDIAALGTVADLVPLIDENRYIVAKGLEVLNRTDKQGIKALIEVSDLGQENIQADHIGFSMGPRLNAAGRMGHAGPAVELLLTNEAEKAVGLAEQLNQSNQERKALVDQITKEAVEIAEDRLQQGDQVLVVAGPSWHSGVIGIVASRLVERFYRPTIVLSIDMNEGLAKGSARSIDGFDIFQALSTCRDILPHFGGHPMAAGMTLLESDLEQLSRRLNDEAKHTLTEEILTPISAIDCTCCVNDVTLELIEELDLLSPYGVANPKPKILIEAANMSTMKQIGAAKNHLKLTLEKEDSQLEMVAFNKGEDYFEIAPTSKIATVGELSINEWNGFRKPQFLLEDRAITEWQLFDLRGKKGLYDQIKRLPASKRKLVRFQDTQLDGLDLRELRKDVIDYHDTRIDDVSTRFIVFLDLPETKEGFQNFFLKHSFPERIYAVFHTEEDYFFSGLPSHQDFKWVYTLLFKQGRFPYDALIQKISKYRGWSKDTVIFMIKVFFELGFVKIEGGNVVIVRTPDKKPLTESPSFKMKQERIELESTLCYSSYHTLKDWFQQFNEAGTTLEEAIKK